MPRNLQHFTRCAPPGVAYAYAFPTPLAVILSAGIIGYLIAFGFGRSCDPYTLAGLGVEALIIVAVLGSVDSWFYNERLMCIAPDRCAVGTVVGAPSCGCDGDCKLDLLLAPFGFIEVDRVRMAEAIAAVSGQTIDGRVFPTAPPDLAGLSRRGARLGYVESLPDEQRRLLYMELVHHHLLTQPGRAFQGDYYRVDSRPSSDPAFTPDVPNNIPIDAPGSAGSNPMFRFDGDGPGECGPFDAFFCWLVGAACADESEHRLIPYLHCELEGDRAHRGVLNLRITILAILAAYVIACQICNSVTLGAGTFICGIISGLIAALFGWLIWLLSKLFNDPDDGVASDVGNIAIPRVDPDADENSTAARGDIVLVFGDWVKDTEHTEWFEIHPVKAFYLVVRDADGAASTTDAFSSPSSFNVEELTAARLEEMCDMVTKAETTDPPHTHMTTSAGALSIAGGLAPS